MNKAGPKAIKLVRTEIKSKSDGDRKLGVSSLRRSHLPPRPEGRRAKGRRQGSGEQIGRRRSAEALRVGPVPAATALAGP